MNKLTTSRKYYMRGEIFMKNKIGKYFLYTLISILVIMLSALIYLKFSSKNKNEEYANLKEKCEGEIIYLNYLIIDSLNKLNNISYSRYDILIEEIKENEKEGKSVAEVTNQSENKTSRLSKTDSLLNSNNKEIPWKDISYSIENIYTAWPTITIDLKAFNIKDEDISDFSITLDGVAQSVKNTDKTGALINLYNLYTTLPKFMSYIANQDAKLDLYNAKTYLLNTYIFADENKWNDMNNSIDKAKNSLQLVINSSYTTDMQKPILQKAFVLLDEIKRSINLEDKNIFYLKYKLAMEQLEIL